MKYRAVAVGLSVDGHPVQSMNSDIKQVEDWADAMLVSQCAEVQIFINEERLLKTKVRPA